MPVLGDRGADIVFVPPLKDYGHHHGWGVFARIQVKGWSTSVTYSKDS